jgi:hypothetical protein
MAIAELIQQGKSIEYALNIAPEPSAGRSE